MEGSEFPHLPTGKRREIWGTLLRCGSDSPLRGESWMTMVFHNSGCSVISTPMSKPPLEPPMITAISHCSRLTRSPTTINDQRVPGNQRSRRRRQKHYRSGNLDRLADAMQTSNALDHIGAEG